MSDLIDREAAVDAVASLSDWHGIERSWAYLTEALGVLLKLPPATLEHARWEMRPPTIKYFDEIPVCSNCGRANKAHEIYRYCPNCGAKMEI